MNSRVASITPSVTLAITSKAKDLAASGRKVYSFAAGEPDFDTPAHIKRAAAMALEQGKTKYTPTSGLMDLRTAIAEKLHLENGLKYRAEQVLVGNGAKQALFNIFVALCAEGDEVIIPSPYWLSYPEMVSVAGGRPVFVECIEENDFKLTPDLLDSVITEKSKALVLNSPSNPTGVVYSGDEIRALAELAVRRGLYIISDEIYEKIIYDDVRHVSAGSLSSEILSRTVTVNGFSKAYSMTGWRVGYFAGPPELVKPAASLQSHSTSGPNTFAQYGAIEALKGSQNCIAEMVSAFARRRSYMYDRLVSIQGMTCVKPTGAFYMFPRIAATGLGSIAFAERLLHEQGVAVVPGAAFGADGNIRLSYACSMENIEGGLDKLEAFVRSL